MSDFASREGRTIVWCHNLAYDIRIGDVFTILPGLGWTLNGHNIAARGTWLEWKGRGGTLIFVDSFSVFPTSIEKLGGWFGQRKPELPNDSADMDTWLNRCRADCGILATAVLEYLRWLKEDDLGNWQMTGNGQAWAAFRHKFLTHKMTVHDVEDALAAEKRAMWAGRCEAYWHGELADQVIYEYDFTSSYPRISRDYSVPVKYIGEMPMETDWSRWLGGDGIGFIADCIVTTDLPVAPTKRDERILWPTGVFRTTLWDCEIEAVLDSGGTVTVERGWMYRKAPALKAWAEWVLSGTAKINNEQPAWRELILKHWSRALIGRMAMSYSRWEHIGDMPTSAVESGFISTWGSPDVQEYIQVGSRIWGLEGTEDWRHSMPMVTGYIQSMARVQLWEIMRRMPIRSVLYTDTDSLFITGEFRDEMEAVIAEIPNCGLRLKRAWDGMAIYGPRQIITGGEVRVSGIPKRAERTGKREFEGEIWESVNTAIQLGSANAVRLRDRKWTIAGIDRRRKGGGFGFTEAHEIFEEV